MEPALVSITFDDGLRCQFERAVPILNQYGLPATFFLIANSDPMHERRWPKIDWSDDDRQRLNAMLQRGHEIGSHSMTHGRSGEPAIDPRREIDKDPEGEAKGSKRWIEDRLPVEIESYCYPFCYITEPIKKAVIGARYKQARKGLNASYYSQHDLIDWFDVDCRLITEHENVGGWMQPGCWHILMFHGIGTWDDGWQPITAEEFARQMAELAKHQNCGAAEVVTFKGAAERLRGRLAAGAAR